MENFNANEIIKNLQTRTRCPHCGGEYKLEDIKVLGQIDVMYLMHLFCSGCKTPAVATLIMGREPNEKNFAAKIISGGADIDFPEEDFITTDDILDLHIFLRDFNGDFKKILR